MENMNIVKKILTSLLIGLVFSVANPISSKAVDPSSAGVPPIGTPSEPYGYNRGIINNSPSRLPVGDIAKPTVANITKLPSVKEINTLPITTQAMLKQFIQSGEIKSAFIDQKMGNVVLTTVQGVRILGLISNESEILSLLINKEIKTKFVTFTPLLKKNNQDEKSNSFGLLFYTRILFLILFLVGCVTAFIHQRNAKKIKVLATEGSMVSYKTSGPAEGFIPRVTFADVAGCQEAIEDLQELAQFLKDPEKFNELGAKVPKGALLIGPPGTGKTLLAKAVAGEAGVPFFSAAGSDFVEMYVGVGAKRVRELFAKARACEKAIIFIDEIDAVAKVRSSSANNSNDEREGTLNALLHELDGFSKSNIILLAATNRSEMLDPAIMRPGRLDRKINVPNPDRKGREAILEIHSKGKPLAKDVDLALIAKRTPGMSGADLSSILNEAAIEAVRRNLKQIDAACLSDGVALVAMGRARKSAVVTDRDRLITAWHEAGHTVCALLHPEASDPVSVSITPRGHAGGITWMSGSDDQYLQRNQAAAQLVVALGGRAAEEMLLEGEFTQGPSSDLEHATKLADRMVNNYGMTRRGLMVRESQKDSASAEVIEELLTGALIDAKNLLSDNFEFMELLITRLLESETLDQPEILEIHAIVYEGDANVERIHPKISQTMRSLRNVTENVVSAGIEFVEKANHNVVKAIKQPLADNNNLVEEIIIEKDEK
jgi:cell division protease FtsH